MACSCVLRSWRSRTTVQSILAKQRMNSYATLVKDCQMKPKQEGFNNIYNHHSLFRSGAPTLQSYAKLLQNIRSFYTSRQQVILKNRGNTIFYRMKSTRDSSKTNAERHRSIAMYALSVAILVGGLSYAAVPLYRLYCQVANRVCLLHLFKNITQQCNNCPIVIYFYCPIVVSCYCPIVQSFNCPTVISLFFLLSYCLLVANRVCLLHLFKYITQQCNNSPIIIYFYCSIIISYIVPLFNLSIVPLFYLLIVPLLYRCSFYCPIVISLFFLLSYCLLVCTLH